MSINSQTKGKISSTMMRSIGGVATLVVALLALNVLVSRWYFRLDWTQDSIYTLSSGTKAIIDKAPDGIQIKFFFSRSAKDLPPVIKVFATRVEEVLKQYAKRSGGKMTVSTIDPRPDTDEDEWARKYGLSALRLPNGDEAFFGVVFTQGDREVTIPTFDPRREELLEYDLSEALVRLGNKERKKIGIVSSMPIMGNPSPMGGGGDPWIFISQLRRNFDVEEVQPGAGDISDSINLLLIFHPKNLSEDALYAIDQYILAGGRAIVMVDPFSRIELSRIAAQARMTGQMPQVASDLERLFDVWGIEYKKDSVVADAKLQTRINTGSGPFGYPLFISLSKDTMSKDSAVTNQLNSLVFAEGGEFNLKAGSASNFEPLLQTSSSSGLISATLAGFMGPEELARELKPDGKVRTLAGIVRGKFKTAFPNGAPKSNDKTKVIQWSRPYLNEAKEENSVLIVADTDMIFDENAVQKFQFGNQIMVRPTNDNLAFIMNACEFFTGSQDLIGIRSRGRITRPFNRIMDIQKDAQQKWKEEEDVLNTRLQELQKRLNELQSQRTEGNRVSLTPEQQSEIDRFRGEEVELRKRRREVRKNLREDIEKLGKRLTVVNMALMPLAVGIFAAWMFQKRRKRMHSGQGEK